MKIFWFFFSLVGAFLWFSFAAGFIEYQPWITTAAFCMIGVNCIVTGMKALLT